MLEGVQRLLFCLFLLVVALLPLESPIGDGLHGILWPIIGDGYILFLCASLVIMVSVLYLACHGLLLHGAPQQYLLYGLLYVVPGLMAVVASAMLSTGHVQASIQQLAFGYVAPILFCLTLFAIPEKQQKSVWLAFYTGWCIFLGGSLVFLLGSWQRANEMYQQTSLQLVYFRSSLWAPWNIYGIYIGNSNKTSNNILIFLLFSTALLGKDRIMRHGVVRVVYFTYWMLGIFTLVILLSRAALLLLPVAVIASGIWGTFGRKLKWAAASGVTISTIIAYSAVGPVLSYILTTRNMDQADVNAFGSFNLRFEQWNELYSYLQQHPATVLTGLGSGGYGDTFFGDYFRGTHNMFLDNLMESGILGMFALVLLLALAIMHCFGFRQLRLRNRLAFIALTILIMLMFREHSVSYLYVNSVGGLCFTVIFYWLCCGENEKAGTRSALNPQWLPGPPPLANEEPAP